jgi:predicted metalloprotease with PDZ domain
MSRRVLALSLLLLFCTLCAAENCAAPPQSGPFLAYSIEPDLAGGKLTLRVEVSFRLKSTRNADLQLPTDWEGNGALNKSIHDVEVLSSHTTLSEVADPAKRHLTFPSGQVVHLRYQVASDREGPLSSENYFRPLLQKTYFQVAGRNFLVYPSLPEHEVLPLSFEWRNFPAGWVVASSLNGGQFCQQETAPLLRASNGLFVGGDFRIHEVLVSGKPVHVAIRGTWGFSDDAFVELASKVLNAERGFWRDSAPYYLISLLSSDDTQGSYAGAALENSFTMFMSGGAALDFDMKLVLAHEMFHSWNPARLGELPESNPPYWFVEGFTDYYARLLLVRAGLITSGEYIHELNAFYYRYRTSAVIQANDESVQRHFYSDQDFQQLAYQRGGLLAQMWDLRIRRRNNGKSLDDAMIDLRDHASTREQILTEPFLTNHFSQFAGIEIREELRDYIDQGAIIPLPPTTALGPCVALREDVMYGYDPGVDMEALANSRVVSAVRSGSAAEKAGIRNGQIVLERSEIRSGDPNSAISLTVRDATGEKAVTYFPRGPAIHVAQYQMDVNKGAAPCDLRPPTPE